LAELDAENGAKMISNLNAARTTLGFTADVRVSDVMIGNV